MLVYLFPFFFCQLQIAILYDQSIEVIKFIVMICGELLHLLFASLAGQNVIDTSGEVYFKAYVTCKIDFTNDPKRFD